MKIAICDDMQEYLEQTKRLVQQWPDRPSDLSLALFSDGDALAEAHSNSPFDVILLDVVMPLVSGIDTAAEIRKLDKTVKIIFLTFSREFAFESYAVKADGYLLKPVEAPKLYEALDECLTEIRSRDKYITIKSASHVHRVKLQSIEYLEAQGKQVLFKLTDGSSIVGIDPFYVYENKLFLHDGFFKCHRSYLVNLYQIRTYTHNEVTMSSGFRIPISRNLHKPFKEAYFALLFGDL